MQVVISESDVLDNLAPILILTNSSTLQSGIDPFSDTCNVRTNVCIVWKGADKFFVDFGLVVSVFRVLGRSWGPRRVLVGNMLYGHGSL